MIRKVVVVIFLLTFFAGCESILKVTLDGKNPPTFKFDGNGLIGWIYIYQVTPEGKIPPKDTELWIIVPKQGTTASASPPITYGVVPNGFVQKVPENGNPPPLEEGKTYGFGAYTQDQPGSAIWFTIRDGKAVQVPKTDPPGKPY